MTKANLNSIVVDALEDIKGIDILELDVREMTSVVDTMIIATGTSSRQVKALADNVEKKAKESGFRPLSSEGRSSADWILIDFGDTAVHVMLPEARELYDLERLWSKIPRRELGR
jgi:ribosome-associated protein